HFTLVGVGGRSLSLQAACARLGARTAAITIIAANVRFNMDCASLGLICNAVKATCQQLSDTARVACTRSLRLRMLPLHDSIDEQVARMRPAVVIGVLLNQSDIGPVLLQHRHHVPTLRNNESRMMKGVVYRVGRT